MAATSSRRSSELAVEVDRGFYEATYRKDLGNSRESPILGSG